MRKAFLPSLCFLVMLGSGVQKLNAQDDILKKQLLKIGILLALDGYELTHDIKITNLYDEGYDNYYFNFTRGWTYKICAVCDNDCSDIDLCLFDENNNKIDCDLKPDDKPVITVTPKWTGQFRLWVKMCECSRNPCSLGIAAFGK